MAESITATILVGDGRLGLRFEPPLDELTFSKAGDHLAALATRACGHDIRTVYGVGPRCGQYIAVDRSAFGDRIPDIFENPAETKFGRCAEAVVKALSQECPNVVLSPEPTGTRQAL